ncbi:MAG: hypothetical protein HGA20_14320, partial [Geobacteraceae bacterium]|nr:hypothetical protein [Geobacteraceae bacterium]
MGQLAKRRIGRLLLDGSFLSQQDLDSALEEKKRTKKLLGQVLIRMGVLKGEEIRVPLLVQEHLGSIEDAVKIAAGERQLLGELLVHSGHITNKQLDYAISEQLKSGEKLGGVFIRLGMLNERQLNGLIDFQVNQEIEHDSPLRLGELLVATGHITRMQLEDALHRQDFSKKKLGEILLEAGYIAPSRIKYGIRLQKMLMKAVLASILALGMGTESDASSVQLQWDQNIESDLAGYKVYSGDASAAFAGSTPIDVQKQTTATISGLDPGKAYTFAVTAYNLAGVESTYSNIVSVAEQTPPTVAITSPADAVSVSGVVSMNVSAADNVGVTKVEFYVNGVLKASDSGAPYVYSWDTTSLPAGVYTLTAKAYDAAGNVSQSSRSVSVVNDLIAPTVALTSPANNTSVTGTVTISSSASDNVGVTKVEFYCNGVLLYATNTSPYNFSWDTKGVADGGYVLIAKAYDNAGNYSQSSAVTVAVSNPVPDLTAPLVSAFTLPATSSSLTVPVSGLSASDARGVTGYLITESATPPAASAAGWSAVAPTSFTFSSEGTKTAYAWA